MTNWNSIHDWRIKFARGDYSTVTEQEKEGSLHRLYVPKTDLGKALLELESNNVSCKEDGKGNITFDDLATLIDAEFVLNNGDVEFTVDDAVAYSINEAYNKAE